MSRTVFILGAGASREAGGPLMKDFLDIAENLQRDGKSQPVNFAPTFRGILALRAAQSKSLLDLDNIESVFAAFEMVALFRKLGDLGPDEVEQLGLEIRRLIVRTLELRIQYPTNETQTRPPVPYEEFGRLVKEMNPYNTENVTVITFNYDIALDYAFHYCNLRADYCLASEAPSGGIPLLKLHGSLNWARCNNDKCNLVIPYSISEYFRRYTFMLPLPAYHTIEIASHLRDLSHCDVAVKSDPVIIPPTWNKAKYHLDIAGVWERAALELSDAENFFVIGYSLPDTDHCFRLLYALGTIGSARIKRFWVFNPDRSVGPRFEKLLGQDALRRFELFPCNFTEAISRIRTMLAI